MNSEEYKAKTDEEIIELIHKGEDKYAPDIKQLLEQAITKGLYFTSIYS